MTDIFTIELAWGLRAAPDVFMCRNGTRMGRLVHRPILVNSDDPFSLDSWRPAEESIFYVSLLNNPPPPRPEPEWCRCVVIDDSGPDAEESRS